MANHRPVFDGTKWDTQFYTAKDALADRPPTHYIIESLIAEASLSVFYGLPGEHKTNVVIDMVICATLGVKWMEGDSFEGFKTERNACLWIDADSGITTLHERFGAALLAHGKGAAQRAASKIHYASFLDPSFMANEDAPVAEVIRRAQAIKAAIIVFDNLGTISGGVDENSPLMIPVMSRLRTIAERSRAAVIIIHHIPKPRKDESRKSPRGHGSIEAAVDSAFYVSASDNLVNIKHTKSRHARVSPIGGLYRFEHKPNTKDLRVASFSGVESELPKDYIMARKCILDHFQTVPEAIQSVLVEKLSKCKIGKNKALAMLDTFVRCNMLMLKSGNLPHNVRVYRLGNAKAKLVLP